MNLITGSDLVPEARTEGDALVVSIRGEVDMHNTPELRTELLDLINKNKPRRLILNLDQVPYMDSSACAVLVQVLRMMRNTNGQVFLVHLQPRVVSIIEIARLGTIFIIAKDEAEALAK